MKKRCRKSNTQTSTYNTFRKETLCLLKEILSNVKKERPARGGFGFTVSKPVYKESFHMALDISIDNTQKVAVRVAPESAPGVPAKLDGAVSVSIVSGDGTFAIIDDASFYLISGSAVGPTSYQVRGDADLGAGVVELEDFIHLNVTGPAQPNATSLGLVAGTPEPK